LFGFSKSIISFESDPKNLTEAFYFHRSQVYQRVIDVEQNPPMKILPILSDERIILLDEE
jgi:hypothetical protein